MHHLHILTGYSQRALKGCLERTYLELSETQRLVGIQLCHWGLPLEIWWGILENPQQKSF